MLASILAVVGAATGSFAALVVERRRRGEQWVTGRSHCVCGRTLSAVENLPVLGWLRLRGRARCCGSAIPGRYLVLEVSFACTGLVWGLAAGGAGLVLACLGAMATWLVGGWVYALTTRRRDRG
jgi:leader peptidase (prepilin peptidase) / N-methyltransferase